MTDEDVEVGPLGVVELQGAAEGGKHATGRARGAGLLEPRVVLRGDVGQLGHLDLAFNNAGAAVPPHPITGYPEDDFDLVLRVNLKGVFYAVSAEVRAMTRTGGGAIVNTSSVGGLIGNPALPAYGAAKRAVNSLTESAAVTYAAAGIRANALAPGLTVTEMVEDWDAGVVDRIVAGTPLGRAAAPEEIAEAAAWLLSDRVSFVTGVVLPVTGGAAV